MGQETTEVGVVVGRVCLDLEKLIVDRHSRCEGFPLLALDAESTGSHATEGMEEALG